MYGNPIEEPPMEVVKEGNKAIRNYYRQIKEQQKERIYEAKMLIVGEGEAGKTTLAHKIEQPDCALPHIDDRTRGITIKTHEFNVPAREAKGKRPFHLNVWDFGGQEIYHATHRFFLSKRSLYVLVADNRKDDTDFNYWLNIIELFAGASPLLIVLNEKDDVQRAANLPELYKRYSDNLKEVAALNFKTAEEKDAGLRRTRLAKIEKLVRDLEHHANNLPHIGEPVPARWPQVRRAVEEDKRNIVYREDFDLICAGEQITEAEDVAVLLSYFHDLGVVLNFDDHPLLRHWVILKPVWATNAVYRIFDDESMKSKQGRFTCEDCTALWREPEYARRDGILIELMKKFRLVYEIGDSGNLVAPQMLPKDTPTYEWNAENNSHMQVRYDVFMPKGVFWQFVVLMYKYIDNHDWVWRNGVVLRRENTRAEVIERLFERRIVIRFSGREVAEFRAVIADALDEISQSYHKLKYEKLLPCNCGSCRGSETPHLYEFSDLKRRLEKGKHTVECKVSYEDAPVLPLLAGFGISRFGDAFELRDRMQESEQRRTSLPPTQTIRIFLASSEELGEDRREFEIFINRQNKRLVEEGAFLRLELWEDFVDAMSQTRLQNEYNKAIKNCDVFLSLFHTKVGKFTREEFETAFGQFQETQKPLIYTYFKDKPPGKMSAITEKINTLLEFKKTLRELGHFQTVYADMNDLKHQFGQQLAKILPELRKHAKA